MALTFVRPSDQSSLTALSELLDQEFGPPTPVSMWRVGLLYELIRSDQFLLLALDGNTAIGAVVALRGNRHVGLSHVAVASDRAGAGIGRQMFQHLTVWAEAQGFSEITWCVDPTNHGAIAAYLAWGARIINWLDNGYGVDSDPCNHGESPRFVGTWRPSWPEALSTPAEAIAIDDYESLRSALIGGAQITVRSSGHYQLSRA